MEMYNRPYLKYPIPQTEVDRALTEVRNGATIRIREGCTYDSAGVDIVDHDYIPPVRFFSFANGRDHRSTSLAACRVLEENGIDPATVKWA